MTIEAHIDALLARKKLLEEALKQEFSHAFLDDNKIVCLKTRKLKLKDEIVHLRRAAGDHSAGSAKRVDTG